MTIDFRWQDARVGRSREPELGCYEAAGVDGRVPDMSSISGIGSSEIDLLFNPINGLRAAAAPLPKRPLPYLCSPAKLFDHLAASIIREGRSVKPIARAARTLNF
jgi:hypothetical protein